MITLKELEAISASRTDIPADEWAALLDSCPEWVAREEARIARQKLREQQSQAEQELLLADLRRAGHSIKSVWDFVNTAESYPNAIPVLMNHLMRPYRDKTREGIARALSVREARGIAGPAILEVLHGSKGADRHFRWALANALTIVADREDRDAIQALIDAEPDDGRNGVRDRLKRALKTAAKP